jgi:outer membrane protein assembly factor BamB
MSSEKAVPNPNSGLVWEFTNRDQNGNGRIDFEEQFHRTLCSVAIKDNLLMACDHSGLVHCFDAQTGLQHWAYDMMAAIFTAPLIVDEKVYVTDEDGDVAIFNLSADADKAMTISDGERGPIKTINMHASIYTSPIFVNGTLFVATAYHLSAIEATTREEDRSLGYWPQWRGPNRDNISSESGLLKQWPEGGPPLEWQVDGIGEGIAPVTIADGRICTVGYQKNSEYGIALDQTTGQLLWATRIGPAVKENPLMRWLSQRSPTMDKDRAYIVRANGELVCLNTITGAELWRKSYPQDFGDARPIWGYCDYPLVDGDRLFCTPGSSDVAVAMLNKFTGEVIWKVPLPGVYRGLYGAIVPTEVDGVRQYVIPANTAVHSVAAADGDLLWSYAKAPSRGFIQSLRVKGDEVLVGWEGGVALLKLEKKEAGFEVREQFLTTGFTLFRMAHWSACHERPARRFGNASRLATSPTRRGTLALADHDDSHEAREHRSSTRTAISLFAMLQA